MNEKGVEELLRLAHSSAFRALGFGVDPIDFAERLLKLREQRWEDYRILFDVADRILFGDFLRFEVGWEVEDSDRSPGDDLRFSDNLDALEIYLLCTCIDALAGGRSAMSFPNWVRASPAEVRAAFEEREVVSPDEFVEASEKLFGLYKTSEAGLTRRFAEFFQTLPPFLKEAIAECIVVIEGALWSNHFQGCVQRWQALSIDEKITRIAKDYLYGVRRSRYTHSSHRQRASQPGHLRRAAESGVISPYREKDGWSSTLLYSSKKPDKVRYTVFSRLSKEEGLLLRAAIAVRVLTGMLGFSVDRQYLPNFLQRYAATGAVYAFLREMRLNKKLLDLLTNPQAIADARGFQTFPVTSFATAAGYRLLRDFPRFVEILEQDIKGYLHQLEELNSQIDRSNEIGDPRTNEWLRRCRALADFARELSIQPATNLIRWRHQWVFSNLKRHVESGQLFYRFVGIVPTWRIVWRELQNNLARQPRCPDHSDYPCVRTLVQGVINDVTKVSDEGVTVRSHRTGRERFISAGTFEAWWHHLVVEGTASMISPPRTEHGRIVGAIMAVCLPDRTRLVEQDTIELVQAGIDA